MSQENVEVVRASNQAWNDDDMDAFRELFDPNVVLRTVGNWPEPGPYVGRDAVMGFYRGLRAAFDEDQVRATSDYLDIGDRVVVRMAMDSVGRGPPANLESTLVLSVRDGQIRSVEFFWDHDEALEAAGLSE